jgi:hypothetical protein
MFLTEITIDDRNKLMQFRIERLLHFFVASLPNCLIQIDTDNVLSVYCPNSETVDKLLDEMDDLCRNAWLILGVRSICLYFCEEEILCISTLFASRT